MIGSSAHPARKEMGGTHAGLAPRHPPWFRAPARAGRRPAPFSRWGLQAVPAMAPSAIRPLICWGYVPRREPSRRLGSSALVKRRTQLTQKIRAQLLRYFPRCGSWGLSRAPTPELRRATLQRVLRECRIRKRWRRWLPCSTSRGRRPGGDRGGGGNAVAAGERPGEDWTGGSLLEELRPAGRLTRLLSMSGNGGRRAVRGWRRSPGGGQLPRLRLPRAHPGRPLQVRGCSLPLRGRSGSAVQRAIRHPVTAISAHASRVTAIPVTRLRLLGVHCGP